MKLSNLPPGCSSPDGGIDHEYEEALERLAEAVDYPYQLDLLRKIWAVINPVMRQELTEGYEVGRATAEASKRAKP